MTSSCCVRSPRAGPTDRPHGAVDAAARAPARRARRPARGDRPWRGPAADWPTRTPWPSPLGVTDADDLLAGLAAGRAHHRPRRSTSPSGGRGRPSRPAAAAASGASGGPRRPRLRPLGDGLVEHDGEVVLGAGVRPHDDPVLALRAAACAVRARSAALTGDRRPPGERRSGPARPRGRPRPATPWWTCSPADRRWSGSGSPATWPGWSPAGSRSGQGVRNRPQRNAIHRHTVDRHLVQTVIEATAFLREVARPDLLLLAALLHDIGKRAGAHDHSAGRCAAGPGRRRADRAAAGGRRRDRAAGPRAPDPGRAGHPARSGRPAHGGRPWSRRSTGAATSWICCAR